MFINIETGIIESNTFLLLFFSSATILLIAIGKEKIAKVEKSPKVGITKL